MTGTVSTVARAVAVVAASRSGDTVRASSALSLRAVAMPLVEDLHAVVGQRTQLGVRLQGARCRRRSVRGVPWGTGAAAGRPTPADRVGFRIVEARFSVRGDPSHHGAATADAPGGTA